jgi:hypothetical protein
MTLTIEVDATDEDQAFETAQDLWRDADVFMKQEYCFNEQWEDTEVEVRE